MKTNSVIFKYTNGMELKDEMTASVEAAQALVSTGYLIEVDIEAAASMTEAWAGGQYDEGIWVIYEAGKNPVVGILGVRYDDIDIEGNEFYNIVASAQENCQVYTYTKFSGTGVITCRVNETIQKLFMNDYWIVCITTFQETEFTPEVLVDKVRDAISTHWVGIAQP